MIITAIKQQAKDENRVSIFVDGVYSFSLSLDELLEARIKKGQSLTEVDIKLFKKKSADGKLRTKTLVWVMSRPHSVKELKDYLYKNKAEPDVSAFIVNDFLARGYVNDEHFARWFAEQRRSKHKSIRAIQAELKSKGIDTETIQSVVSGEQGVVSGSEQEMIQEMVNKLSKRARYQDEKKLIAYLMSKGFLYSDIKSVLTEKAPVQDSYE